MFYIMLVMLFICVFLIIDKKMADFNNKCPFLGYFTDVIISICITMLSLSFVLTIILFFCLLTTELSPEKIEIYENENKRIENSINEYEIELYKKNNEEIKILKKQFISIKMYKKLLFLINTK